MRKPWGSQFSENCARVSVWHFLVNWCSHGGRAALSWCPWLAVTAQPWELVITTHLSSIQLCLPECSEILRSRSCYWWKGQRVGVEELRFLYLIVEIKVSNANRDRIFSSVATSSVAFVFCSTWINNDYALIFLSGVFIFDVIELLNS